MNHPWPVGTLCMVKPLPGVPDQLVGQPRVIDRPYFEHYGDYNRGPAVYTVRFVNGPTELMYASWLEPV